MEDYRPGNKVLHDENNERSSYSFVCEAIMNKKDITAIQDIKDIDQSDRFFYENAFYLTVAPSRIAKLLAHYELFKLSLDIPGHIVECGVFKGASLSRFVKFRNIFLNSFSKKVIAFDIFGKFPLSEEENAEGDKASRDKFIQDAGDDSITEERLMAFLQDTDSGENVELIKGDVSKTISEYLHNNPQLKISLLNIDVDLYKPTHDCLKYLYDRVARGGVIILDDYNGFPGATKAIDEFFATKAEYIKKLPWSASPCHIIKK